MGDIDIKRKDRFLTPDSGYLVKSHRFCGSSVVEHTLGKGKVLAKMVC
jgi:hypothetical protein